MSSNGRYCFGNTHWKRNTSSRPERRDGVNRGVGMKQGGGGMENFSRLAVNGSSSRAMGGMQVTPPWRGQQRDQPRDKGAVHSGPTNLR